MIVIGLTGTMSGGKGTIANFLREKGFVHVSFSEILREELRNKGLEITRENLQNLGNELREKHGQGFLAKIIKEKFDDSNNYVVETIRNPGEIEELRKLNNFKLIGIDAPREIRIERLLKRQNETDRKEDLVSREKLIASFDIDEGKEQSIFGQQTKDCLKQADYHIFNDKDINYLKLEVNRILDVIINTKKRPNWDTYFMKIAKEISKRATCDRKHIGAVIIKDKTILSTGYNGSIRGFPHCYDVGHMIEEGHCVATIHAEANAIIQAAKNGVSIDGATIYTTASPCWNCFKMIANSGIKKIVFGELYRDERIKDFSENAKIELIAHYD